MFKKSLLLFVSTAAMTATPALAGVIEGRVSDGSGDVALDGAIVRIAETGATTSTDRAGEYRFASVPAGEYTLEISYVGAEAASTSVNVPTESATVRADISLGDDIAIFDNILVVGQRGSLNSALSQQKSSDKVITVLSADAIGQLPDENVAEAARRAVGINIQNDQGEGRFISIRGANPNFVSSTINGVRLPSPEADARQVPLDVIDSDILSSITITKSLTPDLDADSIGGNVEIKTVSGLDRNSPLIKLKAAGIYTDQVEEFGHKVSGVYANNFMDGKLGLAGSVSWQERKFGSENIEIDGPDWETGEAIPYPEEHELRDYQITRERLSASLNLDYQASDNVLLYVHGLFSDFSDQEYRSRVENKFGDPDFDGASGTVATFDAAADDPFEVDRDIKDRLEEQTIYSIVGGGEITSGALTLDGSVSYSYADEVEPDRRDTTFRAELESGIFGVDVADQILPVLAFPDASAEADYFDTDNYEFDELEIVNGVSEDEEFAFQFNAKYDTELFGAPGYLKAGGKVRIREKFFDAEVDVYDGFDGDDLLLTQFGGTVEYALDNIGTVPNAGIVRDFVDANFGAFELNDFDTVVKSVEDDYMAREDIFAGYVMGQRNFSDNISIVAGVRIEHTEYEAFGQTLLEQEFEDDFSGDVTATDPYTLIPAPGVAGTLLVDDLEFEYDAGDDETVLEYAAIYLNPENFSKSYTNILPSANLRYDITDKLVSRIGYYKSLARPNVADAAPRIAASQEDELEINAGNPNLDPQIAHNFDATLEFYPRNKGLWMVGVFYKDIKNFIAEAQIDASDARLTGTRFEDFTDADVNITLNLPNAHLFGVEVNVQQPLDMLPGPLDGLIATANFTYVDSEATLDDGTKISVPGQSNYVVTGILGYEKGPIDLRAAATYRGEYLAEVGSNRYDDEHLQIDLSAKYRVSDQFRVFAEVKNINNEPYVASIRSGFGRLNAQYEEYGWSAKFGVAFNY